MPTPFRRSRRSRRSTPPQYLPHEQDDRLVFLDTSTIRSEHDRGQSHDCDHADGPITACGGCDALAFDALEVRARKARKHGWSRQRSLDELGEPTVDAADRPVLDGAAYSATTRNNAVWSGIELDRVRRGLLARPEAAAFGARYTKAFEQAWSAGRLSVAPLTAHLFLGFLIHAVQDQTSRHDAGRLLPLEAVGLRLEDQGDQLPDDLSGEALMAEIHDACERSPGAAKLLEQHVYRFSAKASQQTAPILGGPGSSVTATDQAHDRQGYGASDVEIRITDRVTSWLLNRGTADRPRAVAFTRRAIGEEFGKDAADAVDPSIIDAMADKAIEAAYPPDVTDQHG